MKNIRRATENDLSRIAEIVVFNYRMNFYPIFRNDRFYFEELTVTALAEQYKNEIETMWVYDDGVVKGFICAEGGEIKKLFVEPVLQGKGIGSILLNYAVKEQGARTLWALEKNIRAISFYKRHGFAVTSDRKPEDDTEEYLIRMEMIK